RLVAGRGHREHRRPARPRRARSVDPPARLIAPDLHVPGATAPAVAEIVGVDLAAGALEPTLAPAGVGRAVGVQLRGKLGVGELSRAIEAAGPQIAVWRDGERGPAAHHLRILAFVEGAPLVHADVRVEVIAHP